MPALGKRTTSTAVVQDYGGYDSPFGASRRAPYKLTRNIKGFGKKRGKLRGSIR